MSTPPASSPTAAPAPRRSNARGIKSRGRLLEAAAWCFASYGYSGTRVADIVGRAGMSQGAFYRHFTDKDQALLEAVREPVEEVLSTTGWTASDHSATLEALTRRNTGFFQTYARHAGLLRVMREAAATPGAGFRELWLGTRGRFVERIEEWLIELRDGGVIEDHDLGLLAAAFGAMMDQLAYTRIALADVPPRPEELAALGRVTAEVWHAALAARAGERPDEL